MKTIDQELKFFLGNGKTKNANELLLNYFINLSFKKFDKSTNSFQFGCL